MQREAGSNGNQRKAAVSVTLKAVKDATGSENQREATRSHGVGIFESGEGGNGRQEVRSHGVGKIETVEGGNGTREATRRNGKPLCR